MNLARRFSFVTSSLGSSGIILSAALALASGGCKSSGDSATLGVSTGSYTLGGNLRGATGPVTITNSTSGESLTLAANGAFSFVNKSKSNDTYVVMVASAPGGQTCQIVRGNGTMGHANVSNIVIGCGPYTVSGSVTYDYIPSVRVSTSGGQMNYGAKSTRPVRRAPVQAIDQDTGAVVATATTNDAGAYSMVIPPPSAVTIRVLAKTVASNYQPDGIGDENCLGATWDIRTMDNTTLDASGNRSEYVMDSAAIYDGPTTAANLNAGATLDQTVSPPKYTNRAAAPFAILDTILAELEMYCKAVPAQNFPLLYVNWSPNNTNSTGNKAVGQIGISHFTLETIGGTTISQLYIMGKENVDTDEFDGHVIAHEFGHYLEKNVYRSDNPGGSHSLGISYSDSVDPRLAFSEGYATALASMVFNDPVYVDAMGTGQVNGWSLSNIDALGADDKGVYSERSAMYLLWKLYENRDATPNSGSYDRIHNTLKTDAQLSAPGTRAFSTLQTFASYYNQLYGGNAESLSTLWGTDLNTPYNSLCSGTCTSAAGQAADPFDTDNDIGISYAASGRKYRQSLGTTYTAEFWRMYRPLVSGTNAATAHDQINFGSYANSGGADVNKQGVIRFYQYVATATRTESFTVGNLNGNSTACTTDYMDMVIMYEPDYSLVYKDVTTTGATAGCPTLSIPVTAGHTYVLRLQGKSALTSYDITVSP